MSAELRRLLHAAAETGPVPDMDAILARVRRRHRRRVALSVGTGVVVAVIAIATLWPAKQQARVTIVNPPLACPNWAPIDLYEPEYLPRSAESGPIGQGYGGQFEADMNYLMHTDNLSTYSRVYFISHIPNSTSRMQIGRLLLQVYRAPGGRWNPPFTRLISSFEVDCGRGSVVEAAVQGDPSRLVTYLIWPVAADTEAVLLLGPGLSHTSDPLSAEASPTVEELIRMARSVAVRPSKPANGEFGCRGCESAPGAGWIIGG
jgi:hypothetical protein